MWQATLATLGLERSNFRPRCLSDQSTQRHWHLPLLSSILWFAEQTAWQLKAWHFTQAGFQAALWLQTFGFTGIKAILLNTEQVPTSGGD